MCTSINELDPVAAVYRQHCERLLAAQNYLTALHGLGQFSRLTHLSLAHNLIADLRELRQLRPLAPHLVALGLEGNPIGNHPAYKHVCLTLLPRLRTLDAQPVTPQDRQDLGTTRAAKPAWRTCLPASSTSVLH